MAIWAIPAFGLITVALGLHGWLVNGVSFDEALYRAIALFSPNNEAYRDPPGSTDWHFLVARWTGVITIFGAGIAALGAILDEHAVLGIAHFLRQQVMVIGAGELPMKAFMVARDEGKSAVWVGAPGVDAGSLKAFALPWPQEDHVRTIGRYVRGADHILVAQDDDAAALVIARAARAAAPKAFITLLLHDAWLAEDAAATISEHRTRVLSVPAVSARALMIDHPPFLTARTLGHKRIHALIVGFGQVGQTIARELIINCRTTYLDPPQITVIDPQAQALEGVLRVRAPELDECARFHFVTGAIGTHAVAPNAAHLAKAIAAGGPLTAAYICRDDDVEGLSAGAMLQSMLRGSDLGVAPIYVRLREADTLAEVSSGEHGLGRLTPFGDLDDIVEAIEFLSMTPDHAARAFSAAYRASLPAAEREDPANRSARAWDDLDETFRQATRDAVAHIPAKMASAAVDPGLWVGVSGPPPLPAEVRLFASPAELEAMAELEHERWSAQRRMDGWRFGRIAKKDELRRLHPSLKPYDRLDDPTKEYDRVIVRETQAICWAVRGG